MDTKSSHFELIGPSDSKRLHELLLPYGLELDEACLCQVLKHLDLLLEKNKVLNLTSITNWSDALILHALDSLLFLKPLLEIASPTDSSIRLLDMGTGGGFPGIPLACASNWNVSLLDSVGKKISACEEFIQNLGLSKQVRCFHSRIEDFGRTYSSSYDIVCARALSSLDVLIEYGTPLVKRGGFLVFGKANPSNEELADSEKVAKLCGISLVSRETFELPQGFGHREFFVYRKTGQSRVKLPRKCGDARRNRLADR